MAFLNYNLGHCQRVAHGLAGPTLVRTAPQPWIGGTLWEGTL
jgi:hypothetical protein